MQKNDSQLRLPEREEKILEFWERERIFESALAKSGKGKKKTFVFYEGPPTANGSPGIHHFEARAFKDVIPRYKTMRGFFVPRKAGWDTHGLPVEIAVEKELGLKTKKDIERYGIAAFNKKCRESVWRYKEEWDRFTRRIGFWIDLRHPYITYETPYIETLWWIIKEVWKRGLLYQDFKTLPWCPRCQTGLSSHELGQPGAYKKIRDDSVFVRFKIAGRNHESLLVWTTTPWTLPANVAVAVNPRIEYTKFKIGSEYVWAATAPPYDPKGAKPEIVEKISGKSLVGLSYEPPYKLNSKFQIPNSKIPYKVIGADFVATEEGTGFVHLAPAFGEEDLQAVRGEFGDAYPIIETVAPNGTMMKGVIAEGMPVREANEHIINNLRARGLLFRLLPYEHEYPHCWRCGTPLLYYAKNSWWIRMTALKTKLLESNQTVDWIPEHVKNGRFGEFLREVRDWAFSRERYWGTPLPIWECGHCKARDAIGSLVELAERTWHSGNVYFAMRHGESETQLLGIAADSTSRYHLTDKGKKQVARTAEKLKKKKIDIIIYSDVLRTKETATLVAKIIGVKTLVADPRLHEINVGIFDGKPIAEYHGIYSSTEEKFVKPPPGGESLGDLRRRVADFMREIDAKFHDKKILLISHEYPIWILDGASRGLDTEGIIALRGKKDDYIELAAVMAIPFLRLPRNSDGEVDLHRPLVDDFEILCRACGGAMRRVKEVVDVWFDSGAMPFAQAHWPFAFKKVARSLLYPADFIAEAADQTRGWFYTLLAVATLLGKGAPYRHVLYLGHVLDKNGQKMSKSKGNIVDPWDMIRKYGADAIRWYFYTINQPGEPKRFDEKDLSNKLRGALSTFWNSFVFFDTYVDSVPAASARPSSKNILDRWVLLRLGRTIQTVTSCLDAYDAVSAARALEAFMTDDFSNWYLRRSRRRFQRPESKKEKDEAAAITAYVLCALAKLSAPFIPFLSEIIWQELRKKGAAKEKSVHLTEWLRAKKEIRIPLELQMEKIRAWAKIALEKRAKEGIKVRQPLALFAVAKKEYGRKEPFGKELLEILKDEINVKAVEWGEEFYLDTNITPALEEEGLMRELLRNVQEMRKDLGLHPSHKIRLQLAGGADMMGVAERWREWLMKEAGAKEFLLGGKKVFRAERELSFDGRELWMGVDKI